MENIGIMFHVFSILSIIQTNVSEFLFKLVQISETIRKYITNINTLKIYQYGYTMLDHGLDFILNIYETIIPKKSVPEIPYKITKINNISVDINLRKSVYMCVYDSSCEFNTVLYEYGNKKYIYKYTENTQFPLYTASDLDTSPNMYTEFTDIDPCHQIIVEMYAGPKANFYTDIRPLCKASFNELPDSIKQITVSDLLNTYTFTTI